MYLEILDWGDLAHSIQAGIAIPRALTAIGQPRERRTARPATRSWRSASREGDSGTCRISAFRGGSSRLCGDQAGLVLTLGSQPLARASEPPLSCRLLAASWQVRSISLGRRLPDGQRRPALNQAGRTSGLSPSPQQGAPTNGGVQYEQRGTCRTDRYRGQPKVRGPFPRRAWVPVTLLRKCSRRLLRVRTGLDSPVRSWAHLYASSSS